jgi:regulator of protease activity HflC (stomatin/prohibitin superfamily)
MKMIYGPIYILRHFERGIQDQLGNNHGFVMSGQGFKIPFIQTIRIRDARQHPLDIHPQTVITKGSFVLKGTTKRRLWWLKAG